MRIWFVLLMLAATATSASDYHRCEVDGRTVYQAIPCPGSVIIPESSNESVSSPSSGSWEETCEKTSGLAGQIMESRQNGAPMSRVMAIAADVTLAKEMVVDAYEMPRYSTSEFQQQAISDFTDQHYLSCIKANP